MPRHWNAGKWTSLYGWKKDAAESATPINTALVENYYNQIKTISETCHIPLPEDWFATLLRMPDVLTRVDVQELSDEEWTAAKQTIETALQHLVDFRKQEGAALEKNLQKNRQHRTVDEIQSSLTRKNVWPRYGNALPMHWKKR